MSSRDQPLLFGGEPDPSPEPRADTPPPPPGPEAPLAARMRPRCLAEVVGQEQLLGPKALLPRLLKSGRFSCLILYGPPGCGKTTLAEAIHRETGGRFVRLNAVLAATKDLRDILERARNRPQERTLLFVDELHRWNKAQQDLLLPDVESGVIRLIGATTHNPGFYVIPPLLSRGHLLRLQPLAPEAVRGVLENALTDTERGLGAMRLTAEPEALDLLASTADGDLRRALNGLETLAVAAGEGGVVSGADALAWAKERQIRYDHGEDEHYDTASAFIKSLRGCDPDAGVYWLAKMLAGGEDARFIARRLVIFASEDVGLADPFALTLATACFQACEQVGLPECEYNLVHTALYLACAPKSNSATLALAAAKKALTEGKVQAVPLWLRDSHTKLNRSLGQGAGYRYSHEFPENISGQEYLEKNLHLYEPKMSGHEAKTAERLARWKALRASMALTSDL